MCRWPSTTDPRGSTPRGSRRLSEPRRDTVTLRPVAPRTCEGPVPPGTGPSHRGCTTGPVNLVQAARQCRPSVSIPRADEDNLGGGVTAITHTPDGDDARTAPQLFPQPSDMNVDGARVVAPRALVPHGPE